MNEICNELHFNHRVIPTFKNREKNFWQAFIKNTKKYPSNKAITDNKKIISYQELSDLVSRLSNCFHELKLKKKHRICVLFENSWPLIVYILAGLRNGVIVVPLNPKSSKFENELIINDCAASYIFSEKTLKNNLPTLDKLKSVQNILYFDELKLKKYKVLSTNKSISVDEEDTAFILYTSGTTGKPKGAMITNLNIIHSCIHFKKHFKLTKEDNSILVVPASHVTGLIAHIMTILYSGGTLILMKSFNVKDFLTLAEKEKLSYLIMVPAMYNLCIHKEDLSKYNLSKWRIGCFGGAPMPIGTIKKLKELLPNLILVNAYGSTETCSPATLMPLEYNENLIASVGKPVSTGKIIVMNDDNQEVKIGEVGEFWISGPMVIPGYWKNTKKSSEEFIDGFWKSGDLGYKDENGFFYIVDRKKDVINRGGYKVYSSEIENLISLSGLVIEVAIIPYKDPILGEKIHAVVLSKSGNDILNKLKNICLENLSEYKQPDYWSFLTKDLPKNKNGKVLKSLLIEEMKDKF